jgi:uncharacterized protein (TIGR02996 family)
MDLLARYEAFLRAIFDNPNEDTPRLVFADFLEEQGEEKRAALIRWQCGNGSYETPEWEAEGYQGHTRGFRIPPAPLVLSLAALHDVEQLRHTAVHEYPEWFGVQSLKLYAGTITSPQPFEQLFSLSVFGQVTELNLEGTLTEYEDSEYPQLITYRVEPVVTTAGVEALARCRSARRLTSLDLRNNNLGNDAARALVRSPFLDNLKRLYLLDGNRLRGRVWQQVIERFGEDVVG